MPKHISYKEVLFNQINCHDSENFDTVTKYDLNMKVLTIIFALTGTIKCLSLTMVADLLGHLDFKSPFTVLSNDINVNVAAIKKLFNNKYFVDFDENDQNICGTDLHRKTSVIVRDIKSDVLIIPKEEYFHQILNDMECEIDKQVYLLDINSMSIFETYSINNKKMSGKLALIGQEYEIIWLKNPSIFQCRSNFQGKHFEALTATYGSWAVVNRTYFSEVPYFKENDAYLVNNYVSGILIDIMNIMKKELNFTINFYEKRVRNWSTVIAYPNGTYGGTGYIADVFFGKFDMLVTAVAIKDYRLPYLDFLPASEYYPGNNSLHTYQVAIQLGLKGFHLKCFRMFIDTKRATT